MTANAPNWNTTQYANRAMHIYQQKGNRLRPTISTAGRIENIKTAVFWLAGTSKAVKKCATSATSLRMLTLMRNRPSRSISTI